jgi:hypothetical protein
MDIKEISTQNLIKELLDRGYNTSLLFNRDDVKLQLDDINENRDIEEPNIVLDDNDMDDILEYVLSDDRLNEQINESIQNKIYDYE